LKKILQKRCGRTKYLSIPVGGGGGWGWYHFWKIEVAKFIIFGPIYRTLP
jgi:hypothetical protein